MPLYEYAYDTTEGRQRVTVTFRMGQAPEAVAVPLPDGSSVLAHRVFSPPSLPVDGTYSYRAGARG